MAPNHVLLMKLLLWLGTASTVRAFVRFAALPSPQPLPKSSLSSSVSASLGSETVVEWTDNAPSWQELNENLLHHERPTGRNLEMEKQQNSIGIGPPSVKARLRLFSSSDVALGEVATSSKPQVTLYRDDSAWCPYCQKVWLFLELNRIPYGVRTVPLNAYGDKPTWFTRKVDGGKLPAIEFEEDGEGAEPTLYTESWEIMEFLESTFVTSRAPIDKERYLKLEQEIQSAWFSFVFYPVQGDDLIQARDDLLKSLDKLNAALGEYNGGDDDAGPWFLGGNNPSIIDIYFIPVVERLIASSLYWKGLAIRQETAANTNNLRFNNVNRWLVSFEDLPEYMATKSDYYTLVMSIPSQNGPGYSIDDARGIADAICGLNGAWELPLKDNNVTQWSFPRSNFLLHGNGMERARFEAAYQLIREHEKIVPFASRGAGEEGRPSYHAQLSDPYAEPNEDFLVPIDICLRHVTWSLIGGINVAFQNAKRDMAGKCDSADQAELRPNWDEYQDATGQIYWWNEVTGESTWTAPTRQIDTCLAYLRDRIGVPRDLSEPAAMQLRAHLNWAIELCRS